MAKITKRRREYCARLLELTRAGLKVNVAQALLRDQTSADYVFLARAAGIPDEEARVLDDILATTWLQLVGLTDASESQKQQLFQPTRDGGCGLQSAELSAKPAHWASWWAAGPRVAERLGAAGVAELRGQVGEMDLAFRALEAEAREAGVAKASWTQKELSRVRVTKAAAHLRNQIGHFSTHRVALDSASGTGAGGFLLLPGLCEPCVDDELFRISARVRLHAAVCEEGAACQHKRSDGTICGEALDPHGRHALSCAVGGWRSRRHDALRDCLADIARSAGEHADIEVDVTGAAADPATGARMDIVLRGAAGGTERLLIDVAVVSPFAVGAGGRAGAAASQMAAHKRRKYRRVAVIPAVVETMGRPGADLQALLRRLAPTDLAARAAFMARSWRLLSATVQPHNALMIRAARGQGWTVPPGPRRPPRAAAGART